MRQEHVEHFQAATSGPGKGVHAEDHLVIAALRRSLDNINGFLAMADQRNIFCGEPIIRFQLDTAMTLFARNLVDDVFDLAKHIAEGKKRSDYIGKSGKKLTDSYVHKELSKKHELTSELYGRTSGFIHFSDQHMHRVLDVKKTLETDGPVFKDIEDLTAGWDDEEVRGGLVGFLWATEAILAECSAWRAARLTRDEQDDAKGN
jgi:hypothetical protein